MSNILPFLLRSAVVTAIVAATCVSAVSAQRTYPVKKGEWAGTGMIMSVAADKASIEFDCAHGEITKQLRMKRNGRFDAAGTFTTDRPGPARIDDVLTPRQVRYKGLVSGKRMTVAVIDARSGEEIAKFVISEGGRGRLRRCY